MKTFRNTWSKFYLQEGLSWEAMVIIPDDGDNDKDEEEPPTLKKAKGTNKRDLFSEE